MSMHASNRHSDAVSVASTWMLAAAACLIASAASAGGQGQGIPLPEFLAKWDDRQIAERILTPTEGASPPRFVHADDASVQCSNPRLEAAAFPNADYYCSEPGPGCHCTQDEFGYVYCEPAQFQFPLVSDTGAPCAPDFIPGAELIARMDVAADSSSRSGPNGVSLVEVAVGVRVTIDAPHGAVTLSEQRIPSTGYAWYVSDSNGVFLTEPPYLEEVGWMIGGFFGCDNSISGAVTRRLEPERIASGATFPPLPRASLIAIGQDALPELLCADDGQGCSFTPSLALLTPGGDLAGFDSVPGDFDSCAVRIRFAEPLGECNDGLDNDGDGSVDGGDDRACRSSRWASESTPIAPPREIERGHEYLTVTPADVDGDGDPDVVAATQDDGRLTWWENRVSLAVPWIRHEIAALAYARMAAPSDLDGDGDLDIAAGAFFAAPGTCTGPPVPLRWYENRVRADHGWPAHAILPGLNGLIALEAADVDGDGASDLLTAEFCGDAIAWYRNENHGRSWVRHEIGSVDQARSARAADLDGDDDLDVLFTSSATGRLAWYENSGGAIPAWTIRTIASGLDDPREAVAGDLDGDDIADVAVAQTDGDAIRWYRNGGHGLSWAPEIVSPGPAEASPVSEGSISLALVDFDHDSDLDIAAASLGVGDGSGGYQGGRVAWYENRLDLGGGFARVAADPLERGRVVAIADFDGDGNDDAVAGGLSIPSAQPPISAPLVWQQNLATPQVSEDAAPNPRELRGGVVRGTLEGTESEGWSVPCGTNGSPADVFYRFTAPADGTLELDTCGTHDTGGIDSGPDMVVAIEIEGERVCNDHAGAGTDRCGTTDAGNRFDSYLSRDMAAGQEALVRVSRSDGAADGEFWLNVRFIPEPSVVPSGVAATAVLLIVRWSRAGRRAELRGSGEH